MSQTDNYYYSIRLFHPDKSIKYWLGVSTFKKDRVLKIVRSRKDAIAWKKKEAAFNNLHYFPPIEYIKKKFDKNIYLEMPTYKDVLSHLGYIPEIVRYQIFVDLSDRQSSIKRYRQDNPTFSFRMPPDIKKFLRQTARTGESNTDTIIRVLRKAALEQFDKTTC